MAAFQTDRRKLLFRLTSCLGNVAADQQLARGDISRFAHAAAAAALKLQPRFVNHSEDESFHCFVHTNDIISVPS